MVKTTHARVISCVCTVLLFVVHYIYKFLCEAFFLHIKMVIMIVNVIFTTKNECVGEFGNKYNNYADLILFSKAYACYLKSFSNCAFFEAYTDLN